ncbi:MAG: HD domain-containing protein [Chloroflexi bacterium]|nr:HD domain-containing protein [Chloroflexota bacterium]
MAKKSPDDVRKYELSLLDGLLEGCQIIGFDWRYLYLNDAAIVHARKGRADLLGRTMMECYPGIDETPVFATLRAVMEDRQARRMQNQFTYPDGRQGWFELHIQPCIEGILILSEDVTDRILALERAENELKRLNALRRIDQAIISTTDLGMLADLTLEQVLQSLGADAAMILLFDPHSLMLKRLRSRGFRSPAAGDHGIKIGDGLAGQAALERRLMAAGDLARSEDFTRPAMREREGFQSYFGAPLLSKGRLLGMLEVFHRQPIHPPEEWLTFFEMLAGQAAIAIDHIQTFGSLERANLDLLLAYDNTIEGWARTLELRDFETEGHCQRVAELTGRLAAILGYQGEALLHIRRGALLHDIGKLGIPDSILFKPGPLNDEEWELMRGHTLIGRDLLRRIAFLEPALDIPYSHHEKWDGSGYPQGLKGMEIPEPARVFALADVWDALASDRPYRPRWPDEKIRAHFLEQSGAHFEPRLVDLFFEEIIDRG